MSNNQANHLLAPTEASLVKSIKVLHIDEVTDVETLTKACINVAKKYFTQEEVNAQIDFYESDLGASIIEKQSIMIQNVSAELKKALPIMI
ncbi:DUF2059 domain-containing protein [Psychrobacter sp. PAMC 21119]|uniref:DUF2059 domain-containing protein n=1 Tax=Psychrobacter sp. PAMC 21119 TaxID=1112209 RepID=UPI00028A1F3C|nr:DUF2059 domain-containing protein [Psychrobacter sp. PAMC 21119]